MFTRPLTGISSTAEPRNWQQGALGIKYLGIKRAKGACTLLRDGALTGTVRHRTVSIASAACRVTSSPPAWDRTLSQSGGLGSTVPVYRRVAASKTTPVESARSIKNLMRSRDLNQHPPLLHARVDIMNIRKFPKLVY